MNLLSEDSVFFKNLFQVKEALAISVQVSLAVVVQSVQQFFYVVFSAVVE